MKKDSCIDFSRSFVCGNGSSRKASDTVAQNDMRIWIESTLNVTDERTGNSEMYYQCGSCKAENTFDAKGPGDLFKLDNYDFMPIVGKDKLLIFRRKVIVDNHPYPYKVRTETNGHAWGTITPYLITVDNVQKLDAFEEIVKATKQNYPLVGRTILSNTETQLRAEIEYPIKTMNIRFHPDIYQIDTGPVLYPDLSKRYERWEDQLSLAFIAYETRTKDFADFIIESPVPIIREGKEICQIMHYSNNVNCKAINSLWAIVKM